MSSNGIVESRPLVRLQLGWAGTLAAAWSLAGGIAGGMLIALFLITGHIHPQGALIFSVALATIGSLLGMIHGGVLGRVSRLPESAAPAADPLLTVFAVITAFVIAIAIALWLTLSAVVARSGRFVGWMALLAGCAICGALLVWATLLGWRALERAYHRWPDHRVGLLLVLGAFAVLMLGTLALRPAIPGTDLQLSTPASVVVAAMAALWIATPAVIVGLRFTHRRFTR